jgi:glucose/arabinose dehydrogenase
MPYLAAAVLILLMLIPAVPAAAQAPSEVYVSGMRNPYRWSFDRQTGDIYVGDVGGINEEIDYLPAASARGANLGWNCFSGTSVQTGCTPSGPYFPPTYQYPSSPDVVIGGYIVHDPSLPSFAGQYLFGRFDSGAIMKLGPHAAPPVEDTGLNIPSVSGFGEDGVGHLYATSLAGEVYRLGQSGGTLTKTPIGGSFDQPVSVSAAPGVTDELFIAEKPGQLIRWTPSGTNVALDLRTLVLDGGEQGLLSVAVSPDYATTRRIFIFYVDNGGDLQVDQLQDGTRTPVLTIQHDQAENHNGGQLLFGPDNALYLSTGDGGTQGDPEGDAQNPNSPLGKILRIDVGIAPPEGGGPSPAGTPTPLSLTARAKRKQRVLRNRAVIVYVRCNKACQLSAGGTLLIGRRRLLLRRVHGGLEANRRVRVRLLVRPGARRLLRTALSRGGHPRVTLRLRASGEGGRQTLRRRVLVRR